MLAQIHEMSKSSYKPIADMCTSVIIDEHNHVAQGYRIVWEYCQTEEGLKDAQAVVPLRRYHTPPTALPPPCPSRRFRDSKGRRHPSSSRRSPASYDADLHF